MANFAMRLGRGAAFVDGLVGEGFIILGGPVGDGDQTLHAVKAADESEIRQVLQQISGRRPDCSISAR